MTDPKFIEKYCRMEDFEANLEVRDPKFVEKYSRKEDFEAN